MLQALHSRNFLSAGKTIGVFKFDVGTVYCMPGTRNLVCTPSLYNTNMLCAVLSNVY